MDANKKWMSKGYIGCTFASYFAKHPHLCNWITIESPQILVIPHNAMILSLQFPGENIHTVKQWALNNGFYLEEVSEGLSGLRYNIGNKVAWVQYLGPDSHVKTRQAPIPELILAVKLPQYIYEKVKVSNILHLAHASVQSLSKKAQDIMWNSSFKNTAKRLNKHPSIVEGAKTTYQHG